MDQVVGQALATYQKLAAAEANVAAPVEHEMKGS
jgi:hypothetical protein